MDDFVITAAEKSKTLYCKEFKKKWYPVFHIESAKDFKNLE